MQQIKFKIIHHVDQKTITDMYNTYSPVFILSTGRSGSKFIATLLNHSSNLIAYHEPKPTLQYFVHYAFSNQDQTETLTRMIDSARMEMILDTCIKGKLYVESNQCLTFFAPMLAQLYKQSKFIHLVRHPGDFVRSALRKGWHKNDSIWESGRIRLSDQKRWQEMGQIERLSWLWHTTNQYITDLKKVLSKERMFTVKFEELRGGTWAIEKLLQYIGGRTIPGSTVSKLQEKKIGQLYIHPNEPENMKKVVNYPDYNDWQEAKKNRLKKFAAELGEIHGYKL